MRVFARLKKRRCWRARHRRKTSVYSPPESLSAKFDALRKDVDLIKEDNRHSRSGESSVESDGVSDREEAHRIRRTRQNLQREKPLNNRSLRKRIRASRRRAVVSRSRSRSETPPQRNRTQRGTPRSRSPSQDRQYRTRSRSLSPNKRPQSGQTTSSSKSLMPPWSRKGKEPAAKRSWADIMSEGEDEPYDYSAPITFEDSESEDSTVTRPKLAVVLRKTEYFLTERCTWRVSNQEQLKIREQSQGSSNADSAAGRLPQTGGVNCCKKQC